MTAALIAFGFIAVFSFLIAAAITHFLTRSGFVWSVACVIIGATLLIALFFSSKTQGAPDGGDYLRFILLWVLAVPALSGAVLGGMAGAIRRARLSR
ncbi:hypothetical protein [Ruegeria sp.]|uniref:hypothetical protein n=1 Tax=Ruegeria sp. TaxID=1879320 RepID=UPI0023146E49|nr:hypothetical protein [Ruegeria sp.]MDA7963138.1 hypothetical protein [Ruegeria sp.]